MTVASSTTAHYIGSTIFGIAALLYMIAGVYSIVGKKRREKIVENILAPIAASIFCGALAFAAWPTAQAQAPVNAGKCNSSGNNNQYNNSCNETYFRPPGRSIPADVLTRLQDELAAVTVSGTIGIFYGFSNCDDCDSFAKQNANAFTKSQNIRIEMHPANTMVFSFGGVALMVKDPEHLTEFQSKIILAFHNAGIDLRVFLGNVPPGEDCMLGISVPVVS